VPVVIYHNPRCSKSRQALKLLQDRDIEPKVVEYLKTPPSPQDIRKLLKQLNLAPTDLLRRKEPEYKKARLDRPDVTDNDIITAMATHPILIERPIVVVGNKAVIGRPPESVLKLI